MVNYEPILKSGIRVLRPGEAKMLMAAIPKIEYKVMFQTLLYTGLRYVEAQRLLRSAIQIAPTLLWTRPTVALFVRLSAAFMGMLKSGLL